MRYYKSEVVCSVCDVTPRMLGYWVRTDVVRPTRVMRTKRRDRRIYLFSFKDLVRIRVIRDLRERGISLEALRKASALLRRLCEKDTRGGFLATDGRKVYVAQNGTQLVEAVGEQGQLAFAVVALPSARETVQSALDAEGWEPTDTRRYDARVCRWSDRRRPLAGHRRA